MQRSFTEVRYPEFAARLKFQCDRHPEVPAPNYGRLTWLVDQLQFQMGVSVTKESVRKWLAGETKPRDKKLQAVAKLLGVTAAYLDHGDLPRSEQTSHNNAAVLGRPVLVDLTISLTGRHAGFVADKVGQGVFASESEAIAAAVEIMMQVEAERMARIRN